MFRRSVLAVALVGVLALSAVAIAAASSGPQSTNTPAARPLAGPSGAPHPGLRPGGAWGGARGGPFGPGGPRLAVKSVSGNTITATGRGSTTYTVTVSATTVYTEAGASATLSDIQPGSIIAVRSATPSARTTTITATSVTILLPQVGGTVTAVNGSTITVKGFNNTTYTVMVTGNTRYAKAGQSATLANITTNIFIMAEGSLSSDGKTLTAQRITVLPAGLGRGGFNGRHGGPGHSHGGNGTSAGQVTPTI